jgi:hypothetical protein
MTDVNTVDVDQAIDEMAEPYWNTLNAAVAGRDIDTIFDTAITLKSLEATRVQVKESLKEQQ